MKILTFSVCITLIFITFSTSAQPGTLDSTFSKNGRLKTDILSGAICDVAIQLNGKIVVAGTHFALARYNADGTPDKHFGIDGKTATITAAAHAIKILDDNKMIAGGEINGDILVARYKPSGILDSSFGTNGTAVIDMSGDNDFFGGMAIQSGNKIIAVAHVPGAYTSLVRLKANGAIDSSFGKKGKITFNDIGGGNVVTQPDDKIILAGTTRNEAYSRFLIRRLLPNGKIDSSFGINGSITTDFGLSAGPSAVTLQRDGKIVAAGSTFGHFTFDTTKVAVARYKKSGLPDSTFGINGKIIATFNTKYDRAYDVVIDLAGRIIVAGSKVNSGSDNDFAVMRLKKNGLPDSSFGKQSKVTTDFHHSEDEIYSVAIQKDNKIVVAGYTGAPGGGLALARYNNPLDEDGGCFAENYTAANKNIFSSLRVYPNPAVNFLKIEGLAAEGTSLLSIINQQGEKIKTTVATGNMYNLDIHFLRAGIYYLQVINGNTISTSKFIKH